MEEHHSQGFTHRCFPPLGATNNDVFCRIFAIRHLQSNIQWKKLLDSDLLRAVKFKCTTSEKRKAYQRKLHIVILDYDWQRKFSKGMISRKMMTKFLCGNFEKSFLEWGKMALRKTFRHFLHANYFMFILLISNHTVFLFQFGINLQFQLFEKLTRANQFQIELKTVWLPIENASVWLRPEESWDVLF